MAYLPWYDGTLVQGRPGVPTAMTAGETAALRDLAAGRTVLEVGSAFGWSAIAMALGGAARVVTVDVHEPGDSNEERGTLAPLLANLAGFGVRDKVTAVIGRSPEALADLGTFGLAFIDADHCRESVLADVKAARDHLEPGGILACHDYGNDSTPGVADALDELFPDGPSRLVNSLWILEGAA